LDGEGSVSIKQVFEVEPMSPIKDQQTNCKFIPDSFARHVAA
jgi:hypothetical protein